MKKTILYVLVLIGLLLVAGYFYLSEDTPMTDEQQRAFKVEDMAALTKITLKDRDGFFTSLVKEADGWHVEGKGKVSKIMLNDLFYALELMEAEYPVPELARENVVTQMITKSTKVSLYQNGKQKPFKVFNVGGPNHTQDGTFMLMELGSQTAPKPYVVKLPGFRGYITYRFSAETNYWMSQEFTSYLPEEIAAVSLQYFDENAAESFSLKRDGSGFSLAQNGPVFTGDAVNEEMAQQLFGQFMNLNFEAYIDSIPGQDTVLAYHHFVDLKVTTKDGREDFLQIYYKPLPQIANTPLDSHGVPILIDRDKLYGYNVAADSYYTLQFFTFGNVFLFANQLKN